MATAAELEVLIRGDTRPLDEALNDADTKTKSFADRMGINQGKVTRFFAGLGAAALASVGAGIIKAVEFESAFADVRKTVDGTEDDLNDLEKTLRDMATDPANPLAALENSATTLMEIAALGGQLGIPVDELDKFTQVVGTLAIATNLTAEDSAILLARYANIAGLDMSQYPKFADALVTLGNNLAANEAEIGSFVNNMGTLATYGWDHADILGYAGAMAAVGLTSEAGSTALKRVNARFIEIANNPVDLVAFADDLGLVSDEWSDLVANDPATAMNDFLVAYQGLSDAEKIDFREEFGLNDIRVTETLDKLAGGYDTLTKALDLSTIAFDGNGAAMDEATKKAQTTQGKWNVFKNNLNEFGAELGEAFLPIINDVLPRITDFISGLNISEGLGAWESNIDRLGLIFELMLGRTQRGVETWALDLRKRWNDLLQSLVQPLADANMPFAVDFMAKSQNFEDDIYWEQMAIDFNKSFEERFLGQIVGGDVDLGFDFRGVEFGTALQNDEGLAQELVEQMDSLTQSVVMRALEQAFGEGDAVSAEGLMELTNLIDPTRTRELLSQELQSAIESGDTALFEAYTNMDITEFVLGDETIGQFQADMQSKLDEEIYTAEVDIVLFGRLHSGPLQQAINAEVAAQQGIAATVQPRPAGGTTVINSYGQSPLQLNRQLQAADRASA